MPTIRPVSDLRNHFSEIESLVNEGSPVYLTKNGRESMVIMNNATYDCLMSCRNDQPRWTPAERAEIDAKIAQIEESKRDGTYKTYDNFNDYMDNLIADIKNHATV